MPKRKPALASDQMAFTFDAPRQDVTEGALADLGRKAASAVATMLRDDPRSRYEIAGQLSALMDTQVLKTTLDAYTAESKDGHYVPFERLLGLVVVTQRYDVLDALVRPIGASLLCGEEIRLAEIGHLEAQRRDIERRLKGLKSEATPISRRDPS
ncbi:hypothetical protein [Brevundimonas sp.]|uniref:hypothetical protein n=1 Tax=Brevundimonas sp. TaxID=1871086 RepID=UPI00351175FD